MRLYEEINIIEDAINDILYGDTEPDMAALDNLMAAKTQTIERGLEALCKIRARKESEIAALKSESQRIKEKAEREEKSLERLESYIVSMVKRSGEKSVTAGTFTVGTRLSNSVYLEPGFNVSEYMRVTTTSAPDKMAIKNALQNGVVIPGAHLTTKENLAVK